MNLIALFSDPERVAKHSVRAAGLYADFSKNPIDDATLALWEGWQQEIAPALAAQFRGEHVNESEDRPALHHLLRAENTAPFVVDGCDLAAEITRTRAQMRRLAAHYRDSDLSDVVHIGIGGSELGPRLLCEALAHEASGPSVHFLATHDPFRLAALQKKLDPQKTLLIIASKTFTTEETLSNARVMRDWLRQGGGSDAQMVAVTAHPERAQAFGIAEVLPFWDWVGGRFSLWSAIALPFVLQNGYEAYEALLRGARAMDEHFQTAPMAANLPMRLGFLDAFLNRQGVESRAIISYCAPLAAFPAYLQQLDMESLGKRCQRDGQALTQASGMVIWGGTGTEAQHAFFQLLHQGQRIIPLDFIAVKKAPAGFESAEILLHGHCLAQSKALMLGREHEDYKKSCPGNRPSTTLIMDALTPATLGALLAAYEHKISVEALVYNINAYDQWGVELGKVLAQGTEASLRGEDDGSAHDPSTRALIAHLKS